MKAVTREVDPGEAFALFALHNGNPDRVALILDVDPSEIRAMAKRWDWANKVTASTGEAADSGAAQRELNRGVNFIQAHRLRSFVDLAIRELSDPEQLRAATTVVSNRGAERRDFRILRDIAEAARTAQELTYRALGDSMDTTRNDKVRPSDGSLALAAMSAMDAADAAPGVSSVDLVRRSLATPA